MKERDFKMKETLRIVRKCDVIFEIEYAVDKMFDSLDGDLETCTDGHFLCINALPSETKEHLRDEILKEVLKRFED